MIAPHGKKCLIGALLVMMCVLSSACTSTAGPKSHGDTTTTTDAPQPIRHGPPILGIDLLASSPLSASDVSGKDLQILQEVKGLHASNVTFVWWLYAPGTRSDVLQRGYGTPLPSTLLALGREAEQLGLHVGMRPLIRVRPCTGTLQNLACLWEGKLNPRDPQRWFASLYAIERPYLQVAAALHASNFDVGSELLNLNAYSSLWTSYFERVQKLVPHTHLDSAASIETYFPPLNAPAVLVPNQSYAYYGLDFYPLSGAVADQYPSIPRLSGSNISPAIHVPALAALMERLLKKQSRRVLSETTIDETGIGAAVNAYPNPSNWGAQEGARSDPQVQATWFSAVCRAVNALDMRGVFFYDINLADNPHPWPSSNVTFMGKPKSESAIRGCASLFARKR